MSLSGARRTRREFLKTTVAAVAAPYVLTSSALGAGDRLPASERIRVASIGVGAQGGGHLGGLAKHSRVEVVAVCEVDRERLEKALAKVPNAKGYNDFREVLARPDVEAVLIATPDHWHAPISIAAMRAGKDVYCEKPLTLTIREGRTLADTAGRYGRIFQTGSQQRSGAEFHTACELVRNGRIGRLHTVKVGITTRGGSNKPWSPQPVPEGLDYDLWLGPAPWAPYHPDRVHYNFRFCSDYSGGDVTNWGAHHLDIAQWGIGADESGPLEVEGTGKRNRTGLHDVFYDINVTYTYAGDVKLILGAGNKGGTRFEGAEGWIHVDRGKLDAEPASVLKSKIGPDEIHLKTSNNHMGSWIDAVRSRQTDSITAPPEVGHRSATVCHLANIAMTLERKLRWDPVKELFVGDEEANRHLDRPKREPWRI